MVRMVRKAKNPKYWSNSNIYWYLPYKYSLKRITCKINLSVLIGPGSNPVVAYVEPTASSGDHLKS
jgi:hypothetical protein